jgi:hypothetical protein
MIVGEAPGLLNSVTALPNKKKKTNLCLRTYVHVAINIFFHLSDNVYLSIHLNSLQEYAHLSQIDVKTFLKERYI